MIDGRQYRSRRSLLRAAEQGWHASGNRCGCPERRDAGTYHDGICPGILASSGLAHSKTRWNLIAQDVLMAQYHIKQNGAFAFSTDDWDGYPANRTRLLKRIQETRVSNPVVIGGDIHSFFANDLRLDFDDGFAGGGDGFVGTSISSYGPPYDIIAQALPDNPHVHFFESRRRGYVAWIWSARTCRCACASSPMSVIPRPTCRRCAASPSRTANRAWWRLSSAVRLYADIRWPIVRSPIVATEIAGTSISSHGPPHDIIAQALPDKSTTSRP